MNSEDNTAKERYGESYWTKYRTIKDNKKMHMHQVRELLFRGGYDSRPDRESDVNLEETPENQEEPEYSFADLNQLRDMGINYESSNSESDDEFGLLNEQAENFNWKIGLAEWKHTHGITDVAMNDLDINYKSSNSESDDEFGLPNEQAENFNWKIGLAEWKHTHGITDVAMNDLDINYKSSNSESDDEFGLPNEQAENFNWKIGLAEWKHTHGITDVAMNDLLQMLKRLGLDLPADARSLMQTPRNLVMKSIGGGSYYHFGIADHMQKLVEYLEI